MLVTPAASILLCCAVNTAAALSAVYRTNATPTRPPVSPPASPPPVPASPPDSRALRHWPVIVRQFLLDGSLSVGSLSRSDALPPQLVSSSRRYGLNSPSVMDPVLLLLVPTAAASISPNTSHNFSLLRETLNKQIGLPNLIKRNATLPGLSSWMKGHGLNETGLLQYKKNILENFQQYTVSYYSPKC